MCGSNPSTNATTAVTTQGLGTLFSAIGTFSNSKAKKDAYKTNAAYSEAQAVDATQRGNMTALDISRKAEQVKGAQRASFASHGVDVSSGSPLDILAETDRTAAIDESTVKTNAAREAYGFRVQGANYQAAADAENPWLSAGAVGLAGATSVADRWFQYGNSGATPYKRKK